MWEASSRRLDLQRGSFAGRELSPGTKNQQAKGDVFDQVDDRQADVFEVDCARTANTKTTYDTEDDTLNWLHGIHNDNSNRKIKCNKMKTAFCTAGRKSKFKKIKTDQGFDVLPGRPPKRGKTPPTGRVGGANDFHNLSNDDHVSRFLPRCM